MPTHLKILPSLLTGFLLVGCGTADEDDSTRLSITNGKEVSESSIPWVGWINSGTSCTGTFVASDKMITAAHCVKGEVTYFGSNTVKALRTVLHPNWVDEGAETVSPQYVPYDLAVVFFPPGTGRSTAKFAAAPNAGDLISIVGFGSNKWTADSTDGGGRLRLGFNKVLSRANGQIYFTGQNQDGGILGKDAAAAKGDSGGPLFLDRIPYAPQSALVGVASGGKRVGNRVENYYLDLTSASSVNFLRSQGVL